MSFSSVSLMNLITCASTANIFMDTSIRGLKLVVAVWYRYAVRLEIIVFCASGWQLRVFLEAVLSFTNVPCL